MRITHLINDLQPAGAEWMLVRLVKELQNQGEENIVISLTPGGALADDLHAIGVSVTELDLQQGISSLFAISKIRSAVQKSHPDILQTWMYHSNLLGGLASLCMGRVKLVWGIHHSLKEKKDLKFSTRLVIFADAIISNFLPKKIICCSQQTFVTHRYAGYAQKRMAVIPNGFDLGSFRPNLDARHSIRQELGVGDSTLLVGMFQRFHPDKDHTTFVQAAEIIHKVMPEVRFVLCGKEIDGQNTALIRSLQNAGIIEETFLLGIRRDIPYLAAAIDLMLSSSSSEAFPLVIGEAMACGVPCVVTDVGDSIEIVGATGRVVPPKNPVALARAALDLLQLSFLERVALGNLAHQRISELYDLRKITARYREVYLDIMGENLKGRK